MSDLNTWSITGRLTKDAEFKTLPSGKNVLEMSVAVNTGYGDYKKTTFVKVQQWGERGSNIQQFLKKGTQVATSGELIVNEWTGKQDGLLHKDLLLTVVQVNLIGSKQNAQPAQPAQPAQSENVGSGDTVF